MRIRILRSLIKVTEQDRHICIEMKSKGKRIKQLTSIRSALSAFEKDVIIIHAYKLMEQAESNVKLKEALKHCNYAEVFGSPWNLGDL